jgi:hypothetical protein
MLKIARLTGCIAAMAAFAAAAPSLAQEGTQDLATFFTGRFVANGKFSDYFEGSTRGLQVKIKGDVKGSALNLVEDMVYSDGETRKFVWKFTKSDSGEYIGQRPDLIGKAKVKVVGDAIEISYKAHMVARNGKEHDLDFVERFSFSSATSADFQMKISKMFIPVADAHLTVRKLASAE